MGSSRLRMRVPSPALILSCLALFAALGGSTYAATSAGSSSIHFTNATLQNDWHNFGTIYAPAGYAKDSLGVVHLRGGIFAGTSGTTAFILPSGMRPSHHLDLPVFTSGGEVGYVAISAGGQIRPIGAYANSFTSLDGVSFAAGE
jgi:hypothetical protein